MKPTLYILFWLGITGVFLSAVLVLPYIILWAAFALCTPLVTVAGISAVERYNHELH